MSTVILRWACAAVYVLVPLTVGAVGTFRDWPRWVFWLLPLVGVALLVHLAVDTRERKKMEREDPKAPAFVKPKASMLIDGGRVLRVDDFETDAEAVLDAKEVDEIDLKKIRHRSRRSE